MFLKGRFSSELVIPKRIEIVVKLKVTPSNKFIISLTYCKNPWRDGPQTADGATAIWQ